MNIDFGADPTFSWYVVLLCLSGAAMVGMALVKGSGQSDGARILGAAYAVAAGLIQSVQGVAWSSIAAASSAVVMRVCRESAGPVSERWEVTR